MKRMLAVLLLTMGWAAAPPLRAEDFGNDSIIALARAGIGSEVLLAKIASLPCAYDVSTDGIVTLKGAGVSNAVIAAMVDRCSGAAKAQGGVSATDGPSAKRASGLYIELGTTSAHRITKIRPTNASGARITGNGSILFPFRAKLAIPRATAQTVATSRQPVFYFYFENDDRKVGDFGTVTTFAAQSPAEFSLLRFKAKDGQREMAIGKVAGLGASAGIDPKEAIQFATQELADGIFSVRITEVLEPGDYGFVLRGGKDSYRIYDFRIPVAEASQPVDAAQ